DHGMTHVRYGFLLLLATGLVTGCAWMQPHESSWPSLPSPWSTVKQSSPRAATTRNASLQPVLDGQTAAKPRSSTKGRATKEDGSVAMAILNGMNHERSGEWNKAREGDEEIRKKK